MQAALDRFKKSVQARYTEGTLLRVLDSGPGGTAGGLLALGLVGTMKANKTVAGMLRNDDRITRQLASDALWSLWFRADSDANSREL